MTIDSFGLQWDRSYGIKHRRGWTVVIDGSVFAELRPTLLDALWTAWRRWRICRREMMRDVEALRRAGADGRIGGVMSGEKTT